MIDSWKKSQTEKQKLSNNIVGTIYLAIITISFGLLAHAVWNENFLFAIITGLFGLIPLFYTLMFSFKIINNIKERKNKKMIIK